MFTISVIGQKGGTGKTTVAVGLAVAIARTGKTVAVIDLDPQASASNWKDRREDENPTVVSAQASRLRPTLETAKATGVDFVIVDTAGRNDDSALIAARAADLVLIPTRSTIIELEVLPAARDLVMMAGNPPAYVVLNGIHPQASKQAEEVRVTVQDLYGLEVCPVHLCQRNAYAEALISGKTAQEIDPEGKAAAELDSLYHFISELVKK
ncbi:MAG: AAA family ATPase [Microcystis aeruginosa LL13-03]|jgi:chromosome partitioning protein|nr:AAA family ATPase [Microcystis aeruginosa LL13-03]NCS21947.1 AAA family ATPase [Microcystis aeruginosa G11-06]